MIEPAVVERHPLGFRRFFAAGASLALATAIACTRSAPDPGAIGPAEVRADASEWPHYGNDAGGQRYAALSQITPGNVDQLGVVWTYHTGDLSDGRGDIPSTTAFEATPILVEGVMYLCTPFNRVIALDPETGAEHWSYDPEIELASAHYANQLVCRGVAYWADPEVPADADRAATCRRRILTATNDSFLIALDAETGKPCTDFGAAGRVDLNEGVGEQRWKGEYQVTSAPVVAHDLVVVGSAVSDNARTDAPSGVVRAFDVRTGALRWAWDLSPPGFERTPENTGSHGWALGTPNVWAPMSVDEERDLVFLPTGNPAPDYYRGGGGPLARMDYYGSSTVALRASTGEVVWRFQTVHHDLWDYDVPAQPTLTMVRRDGAAIPAVLQPTKMGHLFLLDRRTGAPIFPVEERPVPQDGAPGQALAVSQPFPVVPPPLVRQTLSADDAWGVLFFDKRWCRRRIEELRFDGPFTPPSLQGSIMFPGNAGGSNWGGVAVDPERQLAIANVFENFPFRVTLFPRADFERAREENPGVEISPQDGTPYAMRREDFRSPLGLPCIKPPWGKLVAVDLDTGEIRWERPVGTLGPWEPGLPNVGGPLVTASGLVFLGATLLDDSLRAFDVESGEALWRAPLPAGGQATPMTYESGGRQFIVIAAGGYGRAGLGVGDSLVAFALPE